MIVKSSTWFGLLLSSLQEKNWKQLVYNYSSKNIIISIIVLSWQHYIIDNVQQKKKCIRYNRNNWHSIFETKVFVMAFFTTQRSYNKVQFALNTVIIIINCLGVHYI